MNSTEIIAANQKATDYICKMPAVQAKKLLFGITLIEPNKCLSESEIPEVKRLASFYNGIVQAKLAKEIVNMLAKAYSEKYPKSLITKKEIAEYTDARYRKLIDAIGEYGFDFVLTVLREGKARIANPTSRIDEKNMLNALRWEERRSDVDATESNERHHRAGLKLLGFADMVDHLMEHSFTIANIYEIVPAVSTKSTPAEVKESEAVKEKPVLNPIHKMKIHFIKEAELIAKFYSSVKPSTPVGYENQNLSKDSTIYDLASKGLLVDSNVILDYIEAMENFKVCESNIESEFSAEEKDILNNKREIVEELIKSSW